MQVKAVKTSLFNFTASYRIFLKTAQKLSTDNSKSAVERKRLDRLLYQK